MYLVRPFNPFEGLLLPTIRSEIPDIDPAFVRDRYRKLILGRLMPEEFWSDLGARADRDERGNPLPLLLSPGSRSAHFPRKRDITETAGCRRR